MAQEVIKFAVEATPLITAAGSFATGRVMLAYAQRNESKDRVPPTETHAAVNAEHLDQPIGIADSQPEVPAVDDSLSSAMLKRAGRLPAEPTVPSVLESNKKTAKSSKEGFMGRIVLRSLPFMCAAAGYVTADVLKNEQHPVGAEPKVTIVADRSGATKYGTDTKDNTSPAQRITEALEAFKSKEEAFSGGAIIAGSGQVGEYTLEESLSENDLEASGDAPMRAAFSQAVDRARIAKLDDEPGRESAAVVVLTNGNNFASEPTLVRAEKAGVPIFVHNVSDGNDQSGKFTAISRKNKGSYSNKEATPEVVVETVLDKLEPARTEEGLDLSPLPPAILFGAGLLLAYREARHTPRTFRGLRTIMNKRRK